MSTPIAAGTLSASSPAASRGRTLRRWRRRIALLGESTPATVGVVVVETVFAYPGFGRMMLEAALFKDIALIEAGALVAVFLAVVTNILGDLAYMLLDPRIRA